MSLRNLTARVQFKNIGNNKFMPNVTGGEVSLKLLSEVMMILKDNETLTLDGVVLSSNDEATHLFTSCGLLKLDPGDVEFLGDESEVIRVD